MKTLHGLVADKLEQADPAGRAALPRVPLENTGRWLGNVSPLGPPRFLFGTWSGAFLGETSGSEETRAIVRPMESGFQGKPEPSGRKPSPPNIP